jgi:ribosomal-protein-alanine N-acetyltransferase
MKFSEKLESRRLYFRSFCEADAESVFEYACDEETVKYLTWKPHKDINETISTINNYLIGDGIYAILLKSTDKLIGCIDFSIENDNRGTFGYVLNRKYWNNGYMSETLQRFIDYLFDEMGVEEIFGLHERENVASGLVMKKCNMSWTHFVKDEEVLNKRADYDHYSIKKTT